MKLSNLIKNLYQQVFIGLVVQHTQVKICVQMLKGKKVEKEVFKSFDISHSQPNTEVNAFIKKYMDESPFSYVSVLNDALAQGALPTCSMHEAENFNDLSPCVTLCNDNDWMVYAEKSELNALQKRFSVTGIDFIFSPFLLLSNFFKDKIEGKASLLVLIQEDALSLSVFCEGKLLFGQHYNMTDAVEDESLSEEIEENSEDSLGFDLDDEDSLSINLDDIDALDELDALDDLDNLDDLEDLDDLDDLDDIEDFEESLNDAVEESEIALEEAKSKHESKIDSFSDDYKHFQLIQGALNQFYADDKYNSQFIEEIYIANTNEDGHDLVKFLEEELFVSVFKRTINIEKELVSMSIQEAKNEK